jgi:signal transduction histidine kinase
MTSPGGSGSKDVMEVVGAIKQVLTDSETSRHAHRAFRPGDTLLEEGEHNEFIYIILDGTVQLRKAQDPGVTVLVDTLQSGDLVGLLSFWTGEAALVSVVAQTAVSCLCLSRTEFDRLSTSHPELHRLLQPLIIRNLAERYQRIVHLHLRVASLTRDLEEERNQLRDALERLEEASRRLIHQEKMATLGQLIAAIAHEINNPASALLRSVDSLVELLPGVLGPEARNVTPSERQRLVRLGLQRAAIATEDQRGRMEELSRAYPHLSRGVVRTLSRMEAKDLASLSAELEASLASGDTAGVEQLVQFFEIGTFLRSAKVSAERIGRLLRSLKSYSRQERGEFEAVDLRQGIQETLLIFGNRLKDVSVELDLPGIPKVSCYVGEINQVWTNIILNACDAMQGKGTLRIACGHQGSDAVWVRITDSGPGVPEELRKRIFEPNFTTKTASGSFGLGLGLAIANEIVQKHGGRIELCDAPGGGAAFTVILPVMPPP